MMVQAQQWPLPAEDDWSTPFAELLLEQLDLRPGLTILDIACGHGIPAFHLAEQVGPTGSVLGIDVSRGQVGNARTLQRGELPWLRFECVDMRALPPSFPDFQRITGNLSVMFLRPHRFEAMRGLIEHLEPGGQVVLTFPSLGTFDSIWQRIDCEMSRHGLTIERERLAAHVAERPSAVEARGWLEQLNMERIGVIERPLEVASGSGQRFLQHPLLRGGFLDDAYECFEDPRLADTVMASVAGDVERMMPLTAQRCALSGWKRGRA
ncbi:MAG: methyltransferase domain-containing protein [Nitrospira sp. CR1.1]|nr:methyltransferase domain-containing protein [Nitrospira sp. CR1.1]